MKKRIIAVMLNITLALGMTACGAGKQDAASAAPESSAPSDSVPGASTPSDPASEASAPSDPASEASASTPESQVSEEQPRGGGLPAAVETLLETWPVQDFPEDLYAFDIEFVGGIKDGQEYEGYEYDDDSDEIYREFYDTIPGTIRRLYIDLGPYQKGIVSCDRTVTSEGGDWGDGTWSKHPDNDKFLELLLPDATGKMISYTAIAVDAPDKSPDEPRFVNLILFQTDGGDSNVQFFLMSMEVG